MSKRLRIGIDGYNMALPGGTGVATYGRTLARTVHGLGHHVDLLFGLNIPRKAPPVLRQSLFYGRLSDNQPLRKTWRRSVRNASTLPFSRHMIEVPIDGRIVDRSFDDILPPFDRLFNLGAIFEQSARYFRRYRRFMPLRMSAPPDIMHWTYPLPLRIVGARNVYTLHDLVPLRLPHTSLEDKRYYEALVRTCVQNAAHILTVSETSRRDIIDLLDVSAERISNSFQTSHLPSPRPEQELADRLRHLFDLAPKDYFLFFGAVEPKKNIGRLIEAYLQSGITTPLLIVGGEAWHADRELRLLRGAHGAQLTGADRIRRIEYLPRTMLFDLVRGAKAVLFPSLYEGFGLPVLEALGCGVPVLASSTGSLPEVTGDAALLVDPYDVQDIMCALRRLDSDSGLRGRLAEAGAHRYDRFAPSVYANTMNDIYHKVMAA